MKKIMMVAAMMLLSVGAFAQNEVGQFTLQPKVGMNLATVTNSSMNGNDGTFKFDFAAGIEAEYGIAENFSLAAGVLYSRQGVSLGDFERGINGSVIGYKSLRDNIDYINIPIVANYYLAPGFAIKAGIQPAFLMSAKQKADGVNQPDIDVDWKDACNTFDFSIPVGLSYEVNNVVIDARYNFGLTKINKDGDDSNKNSVIQVTLGYKFAL